MNKSIQEMREAKDNLRREVLQAIRAFEKEYGVSVKEVELIRELTMGSQRYQVLQVNVAVEC